MAIGVWGQRPHNQTGFFTIILPNTDVQGAVYVAERIRSKIIELKISHDYSTVSR